MATNEASFEQQGLLMATDSSEHVKNAQLVLENEELKRQLAVLEAEMTSRRPMKKYTTEHFDKMVDDAIESVEGAPIPEKNDKVSSIKIASVVTGIMSKRKKKYKKWGCCICRKLFRTSASLHHHMNFSHGEKLEKLNENNQAVNKGNKVGEKYLCEMCPEIFDNKEGLSKHLRTSHALKRDKNSNCNECGMSFSDSAQLQRHMSKHTGGKPFKCSVCGRGFSQSGNMHRHERSHTGELPFECKDCGKKFTRAGKLTNHKCEPGAGPFQPRVFHPGPHICHICNKQFSQFRLLQQHIPRHTSEKPNICDLCGKSFSSPERLAIHMKCHDHEKPFQCHVCYKGFTKKSYLFEHLKIHAPGKVYHCGICFKSFSKKCYLFKHHRFIHKKNRPYKMHEPPSQQLLQVAQTASGTSVRTDEQQQVQHRQQYSQLQAPPQQQQPQPTKVRDLLALQHPQSAQTPQRVQDGADQQQQLHEAFTQHGNLVHIQGQLDQNAGFVQMIQNIPVQFLQNQPFMITQTPQVVQGFQSNQSMLQTAHPVMQQSVPQQQQQQQQQLQRQQQQQYVAVSPPQVSQPMQPMLQQTLPSVSHVIPQRISMPAPPPAQTQNVQYTQAHTAATVQPHAAAPVQPHIAAPVQPSAPIHPIAESRHRRPIQPAPQRSNTQPGPTPASTEAPPSAPVQAPPRVTQRLDTSTSRKVEEPDPYQCKQCGKRCHKASALEKHMKRHNEKDKTENEPVITVDSICHICDEKFTRLEEYKNHLVGHSKEALAKAENVATNALKAAISAQQVSLTNPGTGSKNVSPQVATLRNTKSLKNTADITQSHGQQTNQLVNPVQTGANTILVTPEQARALASRLSEAQLVTADGQCVTQLDINVRTGQIIQQQIAQTPELRPPAYVDQGREFEVPAVNSVSSTVVPHGSVVQAVVPVQSTAVMMGTNNASQPTYTTATIGGVQVYIQNL